MGTVRDDLRTTAAAHPDRVAVRVDGGAALTGAVLTYAAFDRRADAVARGLTAAGVGVGDRVALLLDNAAALDFHVGYVGAHRAGAAAVPINPRYADREVAHVFADCVPEVVLSAGAQRERARSLAPRGIRVVTVDEIAAPADGPHDVPVGDDDLADVFYTSGTTGLPKGVASTHANTSSAMRPLRGGGVILHAIPLSTFTGVHGGVVTPLRLGLTAVVLPVFDTARFAALIEQTRAQSLLMVPAQIALLLESGALAGHDTSSVRTVMFGGAPTPPTTVDALGAAFPDAALLNGYGLTEAGGSICVLPPGEASKRRGSVGKPLPGVEVKVADEDGHELPTGEVGQILLRIAAGKRSYFGDDAATAQTWRDGWVQSGDLGRLDDDGFLYVVGRTKDMIIRGGYNIYAVEVESALHEHPDVLEAAVVGVEHRVLGQDVCAVIRQRDGTPPLDLDAVRAFLADRLADYKRPRRLELRTEPLPRNAMGKLDKNAIRASVEPGASPNVVT